MDSSVPRPLTTVTLVRHLAVSADVDGRCYGQRLDPSLAGHADSPAPHLMVLAKNARLRCSPAARAQATAALIDNGSWTVDAAWAERDFGEWEGRRWDDCWPNVPRAAFDSADAYLRFTPPAAEAYRAVSQRVADSLSSLASGDHLIVTHLGPIRAALHSSCGWTADRVFATRIGHGAAIQLERSDRSDPQRWQAVVLDLTASNPEHFDDHHP